MPLLRKIINTHTGSAKYFINTNFYCRSLRKYLRYNYVTCYREGCCQVNYVSYFKSNLI
jgi:hypothetical protein